MNCKKCIYCVQSKKYSNDIVCSNQDLIKKYGGTDKYEKLSEPCYCVYYTTYKEAIKENLKNRR